MFHSFDRFIDMEQHLDGPYALDAPDGKRRTYDSPVYFHTFRPPSQFQTVGSLKGALFDSSINACLEC